MIIKIDLIRHKFCFISASYDDEPININEASNKVIINEGEIKNQNAKGIKDIFDTTTGVTADGDNLTIRSVGGDGRGIARHR